MGHTLQDNVCDTLNQRMLLALACKKGSQHTLMVCKNSRKVSEDSAYEGCQLRCWNDGWRSFLQSFDEDLANWACYIGDVQGLVSL